MCPNNAGAFASILWQSHFETKDTEFDKTLDKKTDFVNGEIKNYLESTGQTLNNINGKIESAQIWRYFIRTVDNQFMDNHPMMQELLIIGLIHSGDLEEPHLSPHMMKYCKLNLTNGTNISCRPYSEVQTKPCYNCSVFRNRWTYWSDYTNCLDTG